MTVSKFPKASKLKLDKSDPLKLLEQLGGDTPDKALTPAMLKWVPFIKVAVDEVTKRFVPVEHLPNAYIGVMKVTGGEVPGCILSTRAGGEEVLFVGRDGRPLVWIPVGSFVMEPRTIATLEMIVPDAKS